MRLIPFADGRKIEINTTPHQPHMRPRPLTCSRRDLSPSLRFSNYGFLSPPLRPGALPSLRRLTSALHHLPEHHAPSSEYSTFVYYGLLQSFVPDQDPEAKVESEVVRASLRLCRTRYPCIHLAADVLSGLARHQDRVAVVAVDAVLEAMNRGIEV